MENQNEEQQTQRQPGTQQGAANNSGTMFYILSAILALIGIGMSYYLTMHHFQVKFQGLTDAFCNINSTFNCDDVARSKYAELFGIPLGIYGMGYFLGMLIMLFVGYRFENYAKDALVTYKFSAWVGAVVSIALGLLSYFAISSLCLVCIGVYLVTFALVALCIVYKDYLPPTMNFQNLNNGSIYPLVGVAVAVLAFQLLKPTSRDFKQDLPQFGEQGNSGAGSEPVVLAPQPSDIKVYTSPFSSYGEDYRKGNDAAKVKVVEFSDFQCPACKTAAATVKKLAEEFGDSILIVYKNYPLDESCNSAIKRKFHDFACESAIMARCAGRFGKFWQFHDLVYARQNEINSENLKAFAKEVGLTDAQIAECVDSKDLLTKVKDDIEMANKAGVDATPTFFINGRKVLEIRSEEGLSSAVRKALAE
jgi:protein-disulfide isomerase/uncharacterized membrane protein